MFNSSDMMSRYHKGPNWKVIFRKRKWTKYIFWSLIMFLAGLTVRDVVQLCLQFADDPKQTEFKMVFNESMTMPNLTFCISKEQAFSHFNLRNSTESVSDWELIIQESLNNMTTRESFLKQTWNYRLVVEAYEVIAALSSLERETTAHGTARSISNFRIHAKLREKREMVKKYTNAISERNVSFSEFTQKTGIEILKRQVNPFFSALKFKLIPILQQSFVQRTIENEIAKRSLQRFVRQSYDQDQVIKTGVKISWISQMQMCFMPEFDDKNFLPINDQGAFFTFLSSHNAENLDGVSVDCMTIDFHGRPSSIARFMQGKSQVMDGYNEDLCLGLRHEVFVEVRAYYEMLENIEKGTACREYDEGGDEFDCRSKCRLEMIRSMCACTAYSLSYLVSEDSEYESFPLCDYTKCVIDVQKGNFSDEKCMNSCYRDCRQIRYEVDHEVKGAMQRRDLTLITLNWRSFEFLSLEQTRVYTVTSFIADLGGSIGVWLGLSVLSLFQGISLLFTILGQEVKQKISSADQDRIKISKQSRSDDGNITQKTNTVLPIGIAANPFASPFDNTGKGTKHRNKSQKEPIEDLQ